MEKKLLKYIVAAENTLNLWGEVPPWKDLGDGFLNRLSVAEGVREAARSEVAEAIEQYKAANPPEARKKDQH